MKAGLAFLVFAYVLSQFYRAFLAVLTPVLATDIGASADDLARASGLWFAAFALMQIPVGWALDKIGPRLSASVLLGLFGAGGAALFALAQGPGTVQIAMVLIGVGCSPVLMASYYIFARLYPPGVFATLAGAVIGIGSLGNIASAWPLAATVAAFGWRGTVWALAAVTLATAAILFFLVRDPKRPEGAATGSLLDILRIPALWLILPIMFVNYAPAAGIRGLWAGPYLVDVFGAGAGLIGTVTLLMGLAMVAGNFAYGPLDRLLGTRKWVVLAGNLLAAACCLALWAMPNAGIWSAALLFAGIGFFGASFPMVIAHGRSFFPPHLVGRGVTLLNLFGIGGVGVMQFASGPFFAGMARTRPVAEAYGTLFGIFGLVVLAGCAAYLFSRDRID